ncbi:MAG: diaminopimelate epimerase [Candidatus Margulisiibacteriota bacterium]|nr:diaminopimelate epimerase [Candidatus Margulisiibacteriota bacterium]
MKFSKYHGLGNDFVLIDSRKDDLKGVDLKQLAIDICDRHFGVGADGLLVVWPSEKAHYRMQIFNPDGSEPEMCGNGIRCFTKYVYEADKLKEEEVISVETLAGIILPAVILGPDKTVAGVEVDMGIPKKIKNEKLKIKDIELEIQEISMGNPHAVILAEDLSEIDITDIGPLIENHPNFPNRTNVEFVRILNDKELEVLVWERGAGETLACGTGACASMVASGLKRAVVHLPGGDLDIELNEEKHVLLRGPAKKVFEGKYGQ